MAYATAEQIKTAVAPDLARFSDDVIDAYAAEFETIVEGYLNRTFGSKTRTYTVPATACPAFGWLGSWTVLLPDGDVTAVISATMNGDDVDVSTLTLDTYISQVTLPERGDWVLTYSYGPSEVPVGMLRAERQYVRASALADASGKSREAWAQTQDNVTYRFSTPDPDNRKPTGFITVDALINSFDRYPVVA